MRPYGVTLTPGTAMIIAQLTDTHLLAPSSRKPAASKRFDDFRRCVADINRLDPAADAVVFTGDMAHSGEAEAYAAACGVLGTLEAPVYPVPGNCDDRKAMAAAFAEDGFISQRMEFIQYAVDVHPVCLTAVGPLGTEGHEGDYFSQRVADLEALLERQPKKPTVLFMHHAPFEVLACDTPLQFRRREAARRLLEVIVRHPQVIRLFCGHAHRAWFGKVGQAEGSTAPATAIDRREGLDSDRMQEHPVYQVHVLEENRRFITHTRIVGN